MPAASHNATLQVDGIPVAVTRKRVHNLNLRMRSDGTFALSIPSRASLADAQAFLERHVAWMRRQAARHSAVEEPVDDGRVPLWGQLVALREGEKPDELYRRELARRLPEVVARMESLVRRHATGWQLRAMTSRWGSCTPATGRIRLNVRLAAYPPTCLDYVVAHELTHLIEPSHNVRFHALLARAYPSEAAARALLRKDPRTLAATS